MKHFIRIAFLMAMLMASGPLSGQKLFTLEDLNFGGTNYQNMIPQNRTLRWWGDRLVENTADALLAVDLKTGKTTTLITKQDVVDVLGEDYAKSLKGAVYPDANEPLVLLSAKGESQLLNWKTLQAWARPSFKEHSDVQWDAQRRNAVSVSGHQLWLTNGNGEQKQLTTDGSREIVYGQAVHRNEFGIMGGAFWNPQGTRVAFYRMDQSMVTDYPQVVIPELDSDERVATPDPDKYPMAGMTSHKVTVGVHDVATGSTVWLQAGDPTDRYFACISWNPDGDVVYMQEINRDQNDARLVSYNALTGARIAELYREQNDKYVEPSNPIVFLPWDKSKFIMQSRKDGWNQLYLHDAATGKQLRQLTSGKFEVTDFLGFNPSAHAVIVASNEAEIIGQNLWSVNVDNGKRTLLGEQVQGWHTGMLSESGRYLIDNYSAPEIPRNIALVSTSGKGKAVRLLTAPDPWQGYQQPIFESGSIKAADGVTDLYFRTVKPADFDPAKKYPTVVYVYGGPHAHNVSSSWHWQSRSWETYMAQKGYVCFILDNRGSEHRGLEFEQATFRQLGKIEMQDQMKGVEWLGQQQWCDTARLGVHGWSFGGFMTISLMTNYPDVFKVGVAGGPVIDWKWYEVMYGERYMDTPQSNPEGYEKTSLLHKAKDLKGRLQIITGYNDPTVVPQHCLSFLKACIAAGTQPDFYAYPGQGHNMRGHQSVHLHERITRYFEDYLK